MINGHVFMRKCSRSSELSSGEIEGGPGPRLPPYVSQVGTISRAARNMNLYFVA